MSVQAHSQQPSLFWSPLACIASFVGAVWLYLLGNHGVEAATFGALLLFPTSLVFGVRALKAVDAMLDRLRRQRQLEGFADKQGKAKIGSHRDLRRAGLLTGRGLILGMHLGQRVTHAGEGGVLVGAPPGADKGVAFVQPNLLDYRPVAPEWGASFVVTDFSGELYATTHQRQRDLGRDVVVFAPEAQQLSQQLGIEIKSTRSNPFAICDPHSPTVKSDTEMAVRLLAPGMPREKQQGNSEHFEHLGRIINTMWALRELAVVGRVTLPALRRRVMSSPIMMAEEIQKMQASDAFSGALREYANMVAGMMLHGAEELSGALSTAARAVELYDAHDPLGTHVNAHLFDWRQVKVKPTIVYLMVPPEKLGVYQSWLNLTISMSFEMVARHRSSRRVVYLLDEVAHVGYMPNILRAMGLYRKSGIQIVWILQQIESQLTRIYGQAAAREIQGTCDVIETFSVREWEDLKRLSDLAGQTTVADGSHTIRDNENGQAAFSYTGNYRQRPILLPDDIRRLDPSKALILHRNSPPFIIDKLNYLHDRHLRNLAGENPYYRRRNK